MSEPGGRYAFLRWVIAGVVVPLVAAMISVVAVLCYDPSPDEPRTDNEQTAAGLTNSGAGRAVTVTVAATVTPTATATRTSTPSSAGALVSTTPQAAFPTAAEQALLNRVPKQFRNTCRREQRSEVPTALIGYIQCTPLTSEVSALYYYAYRDAVSMEQSYDALLNRYSIGKASGSCMERPFASTTYRLGGTPSGLVACYQDGGGTWLLWTHTPSAVIVWARRNDLDYKALDAWWRSADVGPLHPPVP